MKISYLLVLIGYVLSTTEYDGGYVRDIDYNTRYYVDMSQYKWGYLPAGYTYYFRIDAEEDDEMEVRLKVYHNAISSFIVDVCGYNFYPTDDVIIENQDYCKYTLGAAKETYIGVEYDEYYYPFTTSSNIDYIAIRLQIRASLHYLSIYVYSEKGMALAILLVIIFLPCIIVAAVVIYLLRRFGCIRIGVSSNMI